MADITMCKNQECPLHENCKRFNAKPYRFQSYGDFKPDLTAEPKCDFYWSMKNKKQETDEK